MARKAREKSSTGIYAIILRGNENIFEEEGMREEFSAAAKKYLGKGLLGIRFFDDSVHMLVKESENGISLDMKPLVTSFARTYNRTHDIDGKVFADRFKSVPVEKRGLKKECTDYLKGGEPAAPYIPGRTASSADAAKKPAVKKPAAKKAVNKPVPEPEKKPEPIKEEPEAKPAKKKNQLPSWLL